MPDYGSVGGTGFKTPSEFITFGGTTLPNTAQIYKWTRQSGQLLFPRPNFNLYEEYVSKGIDANHPMNFYDIDDNNFFGGYIYLGHAIWDVGVISAEYPILRVGIYYKDTEGIPHNVITGGGYVEMYPYKQYWKSYIGVDTLRRLKREIIESEEEDCYLTFTSMISAYEQNNPPYYSYQTGVYFRSMEEDAILHTKYVDRIELGHAGNLVGKECIYDGQYYFQSQLFVLKDANGNSYFIDETREKEPNESSTGGGNGGYYGGGGDEIPIPNLPSYGAVGSGFTTLYNPIPSELTQLGSYLWSKDLFDNISKVFQDPMDLIVTLNVVPVPVPISGYSEVNIGSLDTGVAMAKLSSEFVQVNCGTVYVGENFGSALDYSPYTKISLELPYVGVVQLNADEVMGSYVTVVYNCNVLTGGSVAFVHINKSDSNGVNSVLYNYPCNIVYPIEISAKNYASIFKGVESSILTAGMTAGATGSVAGAIAGGITSGINTMTSKADTQRSGSFSGASGYVGHKVPYLIIERPIQSYPSKFNHYEGNPSNITETIGNLKGYTEFESIELNTLACNEDEKKEIEQILKTGFYA